MADRDWSQLSPLQEAAIGFVGGGIIGTLLFVNDVISGVAIIGVAAGIGAGSWINAKRRKDKD